MKFVLIWRYINKLNSIQFNNLQARALGSHIWSGVPEHGPVRFHVPNLPWSMRKKIVLEILVEDLVNQGLCKTFPVHYLFGLTSAVWQSSQPTDQWWRQHCPSLHLSVQDIRSYSTWNDEKKLFSYLGSEIKAFMATPGTILHLTNTLSIV